MICLVPVYPYLPTGATGVTPGCPVRRTNGGVSVVALVVGKVELHGHDPPLPRECVRSTGV